MGQGIRLVGDLLPAVEFQPQFNNYRHQERVYLGLGPDLYPDHVGTQFIREELKK